MSARTREDVLADLRLALVALRAAHGHMRDAVGEADRFLPTPAQSIAIQLGVRASMLASLVSEIEAGGPIGWEVSR